MTRTEFSDLEIVEDSLEIIDSSNSDRIALLPISHRDERDDRSSSMHGVHSFAYDRRGNRSSSSNVMLDLPNNMSTGPGVPPGTSIVDDAALNGSGMIGHTSTDLPEASNSLATIRRLCLALRASGSVEPKRSRKAASSGLLSFNWAISWILRVLRVATQLA